MAITTQVVQNGTKNIILKSFVAGANTTALVLDMTTADENIYLVEAQWSLTGAGAQLLWDATTDDVLIDMNVGWGAILVPEGLPNPKSAGWTNDVLITNAAGLTSGTIVLRFRKGS